MSRNINILFSMATGVGILVGTTGILLYHYFIERRYYLLLQQDIINLQLSLDNLKYELEELQNLKRRNGRRERKKNEKRSVISVASNASYTDVSMYSAIESDLDDEFCDISNSEEEITLPNLSFPSYVNTMSTPASEFSEIDQNLDSKDEELKLKGYNMLLEILQNKPDNVEVLWRLARASHVLSLVAESKKDTNQKLKYLNEGIEYAQKALDINPNSAEAHKWFGVCTGSRGKSLSTKEKIKDGVVFKEHIEKAIELDGSDPELYNLLARFEFEVSQLSSMERRVAGWLFSEVPKGTIENALELFKKTEKLKPEPWKENKLLIAKCYIAQKDYSTAVSWLDQALGVPSISKKDEEFDEETKKLLNKYESHRKS